MMKKYFRLFGLEQNATPMDHYSLETVSGSKRFRGKKRDSSRAQKRTLRLEELECRQLLAVSPIQVDYVSESSDICSSELKIEKNMDSLIQQTSGSLESIVSDSAVDIHNHFETSATTITVTNTNNDGTGSLRAAIANASEGTTILFSTSLQGQTILLESQLSINKSLTIDASSLFNSTAQTPGITIDAQNSCRIFDLSANTSTVTIKGLLLTAGMVDGDYLSKPSQGAAVYNGTDSTLTLDSCWLTSNKVEGNYGNGGAVYNSGILTISNSVLDSNTAQGLTGGSGGAIYNASRGYLTINNSTLSNNFVKDTTTTDGSFLEMGGAVCNVGTTTIACSSFFLNQASNGGALYIDAGSLNISNSQIYGNKAFFNGGGLYSKRDVLAVNVTIAGNTASLGSGIYSTHSRAVLNLSNSIVSQNCSSSNEANIEGVISSGSNNLLDTFSSFIESPVFNQNGVLQNAATLNLRPLDSCSAIDAGNNDAVQGSLDLDGNTRIVNEFVDIGAFENQKAVLLVTTELDIVDANDDLLSLREAIAKANDNDVIKFASSLNGKTITLSGQTLTISRSITIDATMFGQNGMTISGAKTSNIFTVNGGTENSPVTLINLKLTSGKSRYYGGLLVNNGYLNVSDTQFLNGVAYYGGALSNNGTLNLDNCYFTGNQASYGGAIYNRSNGILTITETTAELNVANNHGGFAYSNGPSVIVSDSTFTQNTGKNRGGVFYFTKGTISIDSSTFTDNIGKNFGGIVYNMGETTFTNCSVSGSQGSYGGAFVNTNLLILEESSFTNGQSVFGGVIYNRSSGNLSLYGTTFQANSATTYGGVIYNYGTTNIYESEFYSNTSLNRAGAICVISGSVTIQDSIFEGNTAKNYGGTIYNAAELNISESLISGGSAIYGGAIANSKSLILTNCNLTSNTATKYGGGLYASSSIQTIVTDGIWSNNTANQGGALYIRIGTVIFTGTELKGNTATHSGGAIYVGNQVILNDCVLSDNYARYYGGAINNQKVVRLNGNNVFSGNSTENGKYPDIYTKEGGSVIGTYSNASLTEDLLESVFAEEEDWI
ncbi:MAG: choice-of-anchor Q domain-containing protein [Planctomycetia bacterium]|nr:choice-of-anchor Q domain-containing protein [Planctomycetia bacterium]